MFTPKLWRGRIAQAFGPGLILLVFCIPSWAAVSLDGSNCVLFAGQTKRELAVCVAWAGEGHTISISLVGSAPNSVEQVVLRKDGAEPFQTLELKANPPISASDVGVLYTDMNFDGHGDLGIMRRGDLLGPEPFYYWLYNAEANKFVRSRRLENLVAASFHPKIKRVVNRWRDGRFRYKDTYTWRKNHLRLLERERMGSQRAGCQRITYEWAENTRTVQSTGPC